MKSGKQTHKMPLTIKMDNNGMLKAQFAHNPELEVIEFKVKDNRLTLRIRDNDDCSKRVMMMSMKWKNDEFRGSVSGPNSRCKNEAFYGQTGSFFDSVSAAPAPGHQLSKN